MKTTELPFKVTIAKPCLARWEDMGGSEQVRFCDHCRKNVYNISAMSTAEATALLQEKSGNMCAHMYQRADGTVLTEDCPVGVAQYWRRIKNVMVSAVAILTLAMLNLAAATRRSSSDELASDTNNAASNEQVGENKGQTGSASRPILLMGTPVILTGKIAPPSRMATNAPAAVRGRVSVIPHHATNSAFPTNFPARLTGEVVAMPVKTNQSPAPPQK